MSTRQPTPGPSGSRPLKRSASSDTEESVPDSREVKKSRKEIANLANSTQVAVSTISASSKDKKKRKKKKRKMSVVVVDAVPVHRAKSRSISVVTQFLSAPPAASMMAIDAPGSVVQQPPASTDMIVDSDSDSDDQDDNSPLHSSSNKGKGKAKSSSPVCVRQATPSRTELALTSLLIASTSLEPSTSAQAQAQAAEIARLTEQLATQTALLERHQNQLASVQQSLTCQICLDFLHKPFALAPCGHITCHPCLLRWFTTNPNSPRDTAVVNAVDIVNPNLDANEARRNRRRNAHSQRAFTRRFIHRRKTCPLCRAIVIERPVEVYAVKSMVASLVRSGLAELPAPLEPPTDASNANTDPWNNIFLPARPSHPQTHVWNDFLHGVQPVLAQALHPRGNPPIQNGEEGQAAADGNQDDSGWYDAEDGGIYRCRDCMHEIWGQICSHCGRRYTGHPAEDSEESIDDLGDIWGDDLDDEQMNTVLARRVASRGRRPTAGVINHFLQALAGADVNVDDDDEDEDLLPDWWGHTSDQPDSDDDSDEELPLPPVHRDFPVVLSDNEGPASVRHADGDNDTADRDREIIRRAVMRAGSRARMPVTGEFEEEEESEESSYEGSFIDDDDEGEGDNRATFPEYLHADAEDDEDEDGEDGDIALTFARLRETRNRGGRSGSSTRNNGPLPVPAPTASSSRTRDTATRLPSVILSDDDDSEGFAVPRKRTLNRRVDAAPSRNPNRRLVLSDEEDEDDSPEDVIELFDSAGEEGSPLTARRRQAAAAAERRQGR